MSYTRQALYPCNPGTERGRSTKLAAANVKGSDKIIYTNGRSVIVSFVLYLVFLDKFAHLTSVSRFSISRWVSKRCLSVSTLRLGFFDGCRCGYVASGVEHVIYGACQGDDGRAVLAIWVLLRLGGRVGTRYVHGP